MTIYPDEQKTPLIERMLPPQDAPVPQLSKETGIPKDTLYGWRRQALPARGLSPAPAEDSERLQRRGEARPGRGDGAPQAKPSAGNTCRKRGLYPEQPHAWRRACEQANAAQAAPRLKPEAQADRRRMLELERELRRKDKALAEAAALRVLGKKAEAIWGKDAHA